LRQSQSAPVLAKLREKLLEWKEQLLPKHPIEEAINYALNQWAELNVFCNDGAVPMDNNVSEREMKRIVLNRKNSLFVGNSRGGRTAAILASLTSTCRRHEVDPQLYLTQLLMKSASSENERVIRLAARRNGRFATRCANITTRLALVQFFKPRLDEHRRADLRFYESAILPRQRAGLYPAEPQSVRREPRA
jgi:Transposase IS66 family